MLKLESRKQILLTLESKQTFTLEAKTDFNLLEAKKEINFLKMETGHHPLSLILLSTTSLYDTSFISQKCSVPFPCVNSYINSKETINNFTKAFFMQVFLEASKPFELMEICHQGKCGNDLDRVVLCPGLSKSSNSRNAY